MGLLYRWIYPSHYMCPVIKNRSSLKYLQKINMHAGADKKGLHNKNSNSSQLEYEPDGKKLRSPSYPSE